ncbi:MAG: hypothetical protein RSD23_03170 [Ruthenibacterium sp.]
MEKFVDRIIDTDRKAREIIEEAQNKKSALLAQAAQNAEAEIKMRIAESKQKIAESDADLNAREAQAMETADADYFVAKHALDAAFEAGRKTWLREITQNVLMAEH